MARRVAITLKLDIDAPDMLMWVIVLLVQSLSYFATLLVALISTMPNLPGSVIGLCEMERPSMK